MSNNPLARHIKGPFKADKLGGIVWSAEHFHFADVRGWGQLSYKEDGEAVQDFHLQFMVDALNEKLARENGQEDAIAELAKLRGPECQNKECPDYDGAHPFHDNAVERFWREKQQEYVHKSEHERLLRAATSTPVEAAVEKWASDQLGLELEWLRFYSKKLFENLGPADGEIKRSIINEYLSLGKQLPKVMLDEMSG